ncbi:MAG: 16S rRNA processing protein RimM [FCB group bacterium]|nr:16S rRNA processing protein RimM [FCB group bacterium]
MKNLFAIAKITRAAGLRGEVRVKPLSRFFDNYVEERPLYVGFSEELSREVTLDGKIGIGKAVRYRFKGVESRDEAEALIGQYLFASVNEDDKIHWISSDLLGATVLTETGQYVGELTEILWLPQNDVYVIRDGDNREILIPVIKEIVTRVDLETGLILISPMDGLLD